MCYIFSWTISNRRDVEAAAAARKGVKGSSAAEERLRKARQHERTTAALQASVRSSQMELSAKQDALSAAEARIAEREQAVKDLEEKLGPNGEQETGANDVKTRERELEEWSKALGEQAAAMREQALRLEAAFEQLREREASAMQEVKTDSGNKQEQSMTVSAAASAGPTRITARAMNEGEVSRQLEQETVRLAEKARELDAERRRLAIAAETAEREQSRAQKERQEAFEARKDAAKLRVELERERARLEAEKGGLAAEKSLLAAERGRLATDRARALRREGRVVGFSGEQGTDLEERGIGDDGEEPQSRPPHTAREPRPQLRNGATMLGNERQSSDESEGMPENVTGRVAPCHSAEETASPSQRQPQATRALKGDVATVAEAHGQSTPDVVQPDVLGSAVKSRQINPVPPRAETPVLTQKNGNGMEAEENSSNEELHNREEGDRSINRSNRTLSRREFTTQPSETEEPRASQPTVESVRRRLHVHRRGDGHDDEGGSDTSEESSIDIRRRPQPGVASTGGVNMPAFRADQQRSRKTGSSSPLSNQGGAGSFRVSRSSAAAAAAAIASREDPFLAQLHARLAGADYTFRKSLGRREALLSKFGPAGGSICPSEVDTSDFPSGSVDISPETKASDSSSPPLKGVEHQRNTAGLTSSNDQSSAGVAITERSSERNRLTGRSMMVRASAPQRGGRRQSSLVAAVVSEESLEMKSLQTPIGDSRMQQSSVKGTPGPLRVGPVEASGASDTDDTEAEKENLREMMWSLCDDDASEGSLHGREEASGSSIAGEAFTTPVQQPHVLDEESKGSGDERVTTGEADAGGGNTLMSSLRAQNEIIVSRIQDASLQVIYVVCSDREEKSDSP